ncbi:portal protein [Roseomonas sp. NAR14]|uniref:Portal protein n=1 Tax=Roseomonas acroporae TaxID=2937791 RepID=A0A9X1YG57_9PROT|nr:portal protein [Roseomonas acroporae]MCK8788087.1 portal protein [Roseomonas acroporae]
MPLDAAPPRQPSRPAQHEGREVGEMLSRLNRRLASLRAARDPYMATWRELRDFILPARGRLDTQPQPGDTRRGRTEQTRILDRTATKAAADLSAFLMAGMTSPARPWFRLTVPDQDLADVSEVRAWLDEVRDRMNKVFAASNFYNAMATLYTELAGFGTGAVLIVQDYDTVIRCYPLTAGEYMIGLDQRLRADTLYREYVITIGQAAAQFGLENLSIGARQAHEAGRLDQEIVVCHAIEPNERRDRARGDWRRLPWLSVWWEVGRQGERALSIRGFHDFPVIAPRWDVVGSDPYGHGPGEDALPDVKALQFLKRKRARVVDKMAEPPLVAPASLAQSQISVLPNAVNFVSDAATAKLSPLYAMPPHTQSLDLEIAEAREAIRQTFKGDLITMFAASDRREMTAAEVAARSEEKMLMLGPVLERFHDEALNPVIDIVFGIMARGGLLPPIPDLLRGRHVEPDYISLLAQAQKAIGTTAIERVVGFVGNLAQAVPEVLDNLNTDETVGVYHNLLGASPRMLRGDDEVAAIRKARAEAAAKAQAMEQAQAMAASVKQGAEGARLLSETQTGAGQNALSQILGNG